MKIGWGSVQEPIRSPRGAARLALCVLLSGNPCGAVAQVARPLSPPTREEVTRQTTPPKPPQSRLEVEGGIERAPCALDGPEFRSIHFVLRGAEFEGPQGLVGADLTSSYSSYVGKEVPISTVCEIRDRAATILRDAGYIAAVQVPEQRIESGTVRFQVLVARLTQVRVRGEATGAETVLAGYLNQLTKRPLFNRHEAERYLLLASDLPGYTVRLTLAPGRNRPRRRDRRRHRPAHAGLCRFRRSEWRVAGTWALGRIAARRVVRPHRPWRPDGPFAVQHVQISMSSRPSSSHTTCGLDPTG